MEGQGVTNYAINKPSYAYSTATTEFDDALMKREIVSHTQAMMGKGASDEEAQRLTFLKENQKQQQHPIAIINTSSSCQEGDENDSDSSFNDDDDDAFMERYRQERMAQFQQAEEERQQGRRFGQAVYIQRSDWSREVNDASQNAWVVVCLTSSDSERTGLMEEAVKVLAREWVHIKCVLIPAHMAIEKQLPSEQLPCLFLYRNGVMQKQLLSLPQNMTSDRLQELLHPLVA